MEKIKRNKLICIHCDKKMSRNHLLYKHLCKVLINQKEKEQEEKEKIKREKEQQEKEKIKRDKINEKAKERVKCPDCLKEISQGYLKTHMTFSYNCYLIKKEKIKLDEEKKQIEKEREDEYYDEFKYLIPKERKGLCCYEDCNNKALLKRFKCEVHK